MSQQRIPPEVKKQADEIVERFNRTSVNDPNCYYLTRYRGRFLYLDRFDYGMLAPICRLEYTGTPDAWEFAIYKHSSERYDPDDWLIPGFDHLDGTIEGAMKASLEAYPKRDYRRRRGVFVMFFRALLKLLR